MAAFILVSINDELTELAESIKECCSPSATVSLGSVKTGENGTFYHTRVVQAAQTEKPIAMHSALEEHFAQFRLENGLANDALVNIFLLSSVNSEDARWRHDWIIDSFDKLYDKGNGVKVNYRLVQIVLCYDVKNPLGAIDIDNDHLRRLIERQKSGQKSGAMDLMCLIGNRTLGGASLCLSKEGHNLFVPRMLADFMMLASSEGQYDVFSSITANVVTSCFSMGWAEAMYYYPDVERYFVEADQCSMLEHCLACNDESLGFKVAEAMEADKMPLGLRERRKRFEAEYTSVPIDEDINQKKETSDYRTEQVLKELKPLIDNYTESISENTKELDKCKEEVEGLKAQRGHLVQQKDNTQNDPDAVGSINQAMEEIEKEIEKKQKTIDLLERKLRDAIYYTDRDEISKVLLKTPDDLLDEVEKEQQEKYDKLVRFICSSEFKGYAMDFGNVKPAEPTPQPAQKSEEPSGCMGWLGRLFGKEKKAPKQVQMPPDPEPTDWLKKIGEVCAERDAKSIFGQFVNKVKQQEERLERMQKELERFCLTKHCRSVELIDLDKLRQEQEMAAEARIAECIERCNTECTKKHAKDSSSPEKPSLQMLMEEMEKVSREYAKKKYGKLNWELLPQFVKDCTPQQDPELLATYLKTRYTYAAPFVDYRVVGNQNERSSVVAAYSDMPKFGGAKTYVQNDFANASTTNFYQSKHIRDKVCVFHFNPLTDAMLDNLVMLHDQK